MSGPGGTGGKFNPKSLLYDRSATLPPFLARLHAQHAPRGGGDGPDPILAARRRPTKKPRSGSEEAEDAPLVLDEQGNVVDTVSVGRDGTVTERFRVEGEGEGDNNTGEGTKEGEGKQGGKEGDKNENGDGNKDGKEDKSVGIGASKKKRKVGKVIAGDAGDDSEQEQEQEQDGDDRKSSTGKIKDKNSGNTEQAGEKPKPNKTTTKKKTTAKKIKLSFGDGDEEG